MGFRWKLRIRKSMRRKHFHICRTCIFADGFTLLELLIVIAIISLLLTVLIPGLGKARAMAKRISCQSNLRQLSIAWGLYFDDHDGNLYRGLNTNHDFGGWEGTGGFGPNRPLNVHVGLDPGMPTENATKVFRCPADRGGIFGVPPEERAYQYFGNSYQTNILIIGPTQIGFATPILKPLHDAINARLENFKFPDISTHPASLALVGDNNWMQEWHPLIPTHAEDWHDKARHHNIAFLDGHVDFVRIRKGLYVTPEYSIVPFRQLNQLACQVQEEIE